MIGIYKITNLLNGKSYIGQSRDIEQRYKEHLYHSQSNIDKAIREFGSENFSFDVLELCDESMLDERERYYIRFYSSIENGYNLIAGGQHNVGESNSNVKLSEQEVYYIRECYNNHMNKQQVYEQFKDRISYQYFSNLWEGRSWKYVHYDVYTEQNKNFYRSYGSTNRENNIKMNFTCLEVFELRKMYQYMTTEQIYELVKDRCSLSGLKSILHGHLQKYPDLIVYKKKERKWVRK